MKIRTRQDLVDAALAIANNILAPSDLEFSEYITDTIKIVSDEWDDAKNIDYKTSGLIFSVQKDVIGMYNFLYNTNITIKELDKYEFLIVKFSIEEGCIKFISRLAKSIIQEITDELKCFTGMFDGMTPRQRIALALLLVAFAGSWKAPDIIRAIRENPSISHIFDSNDDIVEAVAKNQKTSITIINNLGNGYVVYNGIESKKEDYENGLVKVDSSDIIPVQINDEFFILKYDFNGQKACLSHNGDEFWASTEWLNQEGRDRLIEINAVAITQKRATRQRINMSCKIRNGKICKAIIENIGLPPRQGSIDVATALGSAKVMSDKLEQGSLLDN